MDDMDTPRTRDPAQAFDEMRAELALLRRAVEGLAAEREKLPDYSETLGQMADRLGNIAHNIHVIAKHPAMSLTPETLAERIATVASIALEADKAIIGKSEELHRQACVDLNRAIGKVRTREDHRWHLLWCGIGAAITASLLWMIYPGWVANLGPQSWHWPERVARRTMGEPTLWDAGIRLMRAGDPEGWQAIVDAADMRQANRDAIAACENAAAKVKQPVRCAIVIGNPSS